MGQEGRHPVNGGESPIQVGCTVSIFRGPVFKKRFSDRGPCIYIQATHFEWGFGGISINSNYQTAHLHTDKDDVDVNDQWSLDLNDGFLLGGVTLASQDRHKVHILFLGDFQEIADHDDHGNPFITLAIGHSTISSAELTIAGKAINLAQPKGPIQIQWK
jgi:hypothetical protein